MRRCTGHHLAGWGPHGLVGGTTLLPEGLREIHYTMELQDGGVHEAVVGEVPFEETYARDQRGRICG